MYGTETDHSAGTMSKPERTFERCHVAIDRGVRVAVAFLLRLVRGDLVGCDVVGSHSGERTPKAIEHRVRILRVAPILLVVVSNQLAEILERGALDVACGEAATRDLAEALLQQRARVPVSIDLMVPEEGIEPSRGVTPTGF